MGLTVEQTRQAMQRLNWAMGSLPDKVQILHCQIDATNGPAIQIETGSGWLARKELPETDATAQIGGRTLEEATEADWLKLRGWTEQFTKKAE